MSLYLTLSHSPALSLVLQSVPIAEHCLWSGCSTQYALPPCPWFSRTQTAAPTCGQLLGAYLEMTCACRSLWPLSCSPFLTPCASSGVCCCPQPWVAKPWAPAPNQCPRCFLPCLTFIFLHSLFGVFSVPLWHPSLSYLFPSCALSLFLIPTPSLGLPSSLLSPWPTPGHTCILRQNWLYPLSLEVTAPKDLKAISAKVLMQMVASGLYLYFNKNFQGQQNFNPEEWISRGRLLSTIMGQGVKYLGRSCHLLYLS